jgi:hypothetical protein
MGVGRLVVAVLVTVGLAGCSAGGDDGAPKYLYPPDAFCPGVDPHRAVATPAPLTPDITPVTVTICTFDTVFNGSPGVDRQEWEWRNVRRSTGPFSDLITALRTPPPTHRTGDQVCPAMMQTPMFIALTDATGRVVIPAIPADQCGFRLPALDAALNALNWVAVETR